MPVRYVSPELAEASRGRPGMSGEDFLALANHVALLDPHF